MASVMTLLSADLLQASDFMACVMILLPPHFGPASDFKCAALFAKDVHGAGLFILRFQMCALLWLYMPNVWLRGRL
jgi:hypothetical protein